MHNNSVLTPSEATSSFEPMASFKNSFTTKDISGLQHNKKLIAQMSQVKYDEPTISTEAMNDSNTSEDPEISNQEHRVGMSNSSNVRWVRRRTVCGTAGYRPPEQVQERFVSYSSRNGYDERADWFSLGVCCFTMLTGRRPYPTKKELIQSDSQRENLLEMEVFPNLEEEEARKLLRDAEIQCLMFEVRYPEHFSTESDTQNFIESLLSRNPDDRLRYEGIINHAWMKNHSFDVEEIFKTCIPDWVKDHAHLQSIESSDGNPSLQEGHESMFDGKYTRTLSECIDDLCSDRFEKRDSTHNEKFVAKWKHPARPETVQLFRNWNYVSNEAIKLEMLTSKIRQ